MKKIVLASAFLVAFVSCKKETEAEVAVTEPQVEYAVFGDSINTDGVLSYQEMTSKFGDLKEGDTVNLKFSSTIKNVCQEKGCWMNVALDNDKESFVKFKDYAYFVPMNAENKEVVVSGKAYVSEVSVADLKHYAEDAGKSQAAIDSIKEPKKKYLFMADGVLIKK
ncbi:DUF4920 domain-containing protein [uncultured Flavobacterium sp.]|uniref:DUF4920 domain-containing protein n=1 Tax=uncultured Flavobacterium sp. TaxID=165435 RepID=UPI0030EB8732|tara:strand:- start:45987 stop:46484 length:498 start_codon:yes stop_codon:yes gene_type:complete